MPREAGWSLSAGGEGTAALDVLFVDRDRDDAFPVSGIHRCDQRPDPDLHSVFRRQSDRFSLDPAFGTGS